MINSKYCAFCIFLISFGFLSCNTAGQNVEYTHSLIPIRTIDFNIGFNTWSVSLEDYDSIEKISFADFRTHKKIILSPLSGTNTEFSVIPLDTLVNMGIQISAYEIINRDTILLFEDYANRIFHIDFNGNLINHFDFNRDLNKSSYYDLYSSRMGFGFNNTNDVIFHASSNSQNDTYRNNYKNNLEELKNQQRSHPYFFRVKDLFSVNFEYDFGLDNFYARFTNSNHLFFESAHYMPNDSVLYVFSNYSDTLYEVSEKDLKIKKLHQIKSDYSDLGYRPATISEWKLDANHHNELGRTKGFIQQIEIDPFNNLIYIIALHEIPLETPSGERIKPWSILIYDLDFHKLGEVKMDEMKYGSFMVSTSEGLLISNAPYKQNDTDFYEKTTFELFEVHKN